MDPLGRVSGAQKPGMPLVGHGAQLRCSAAGGLRGTFSGVYHLYLEAQGSYNQAVLNRL